MGCEFKRGAGRGLPWSLSDSFHSNLEAEATSGSAISLLDDDFSMDHFLLMAARVDGGEF